MAPLSSQSPLPSSYDPPPGAPARSSPPGAAYHLVRARVNDYWERIPSEVIHRRRPVSASFFGHFAYSHRLYTLPARHQVLGRGRVLPDELRATGVIRKGETGRTLPRKDGDNELARGEATISRGCAQRLPAGQRTAHHSILRPHGVHTRI